MLQKKHRLHRASDIQRLLRQGRRIKVDGFFLFLRRGENIQNSKCSVIVGKKFSPLAVVRNKQKRILREVLREVVMMQINRTPFEAVIMCTKKRKVLSYKDAKNSFLPVFKSNL